MAEDLIKDIEQGKSKVLGYWREQLDLSQCQRIGNGLKHNTVLTSLDLWDDNIGPGAKYLASALQVNATLKTLVLSKNNIGDTEAKDLAAALHVNAILEELYLLGNNIGDSGAKDFGEALEVNTVLKTLVLFKNIISNKGGNYILKAFDKNRTLTLIDLRSNNIDDALRTSICEKAQANKQYPEKLKSGLKTEVGKVLHGNGFTELVVPFYDNNIHSVEQAYELSRAELKAMGNISMAKRKVLEGLFIPEYNKTALGILLLQAGLQQYAKVFYAEELYNTDHDLTADDFKEMEVSDPEHIQILERLFNGNPAPVKPKHTTKPQESKKFGGFISHYKKEAGTTAKLMKFMMKNDIRYSQTEVFLDTESLTDLDQLLNDVRQSGALVVILTKNYFHRPWCLTELVAAWKHDVPFVPCRLVGVEQEFDPASFVPLIANYKDLTDKSGWDILIKRGFTKEDVRDAIERLSMVIARSFAPHESDRIQEAQFSLILDDLAERSNTE